MTIESAPAPKPRAVRVPISSTRSRRAENARESNETAALIVSATELILAFLGVDERPPNAFGPARYREGELPPVWSSFPPCSTFHLQ